MDPWSLNMYIKQEMFQIPIQDTFFFRIGGLAIFYIVRCIFSISSISSGFLRLTYGLNSTPENFQKFMFDNIGDLEDVIVYFDDILFFSKILKEHNLRLEKVLGRISKTGLTLN